jgi:cystathionine beta-lyase/cystathionine gamma-synthase
MMLAANSDNTPERNRTSMTKRDGPTHPDWDLDTRLIHDHQAPDETTGAVTPPMHLSTTFVRERVDDDSVYRYARSGNPTRNQLEAILAGLEHGADAAAFGSGMAAIYAAMQLLSGGDHAIVGYDCYLTTYDLFANDLPRYGVNANFVDLTDIEAVQAAMKPNTRMIWIESPANPLLDIVDLREMVTIASQSEAITVVDNTFASPYCQNPIDFGIDLVVHSTTKYLGGHSDLVGGAVISRTPELAAKIKNRQYNLGAVPSPFDCWLLIRGMRTLGVRMRQHMANAQAVAEFLSGHPKVTRALYPGLPGHLGHELARSQMRGGFSGMVSFEVTGGSAEASRVSENTQVFQLATSLGGVESLIYPPTAWMEASDPALLAQIPGSPWAQNPGLIRLSVGIESSRDLINDLERALG